ncbi:hypothetical protein [Sphingomonas sp. IC081]|uniref:hypothetical protein n=1 Tax=Sphingomonas sp. IC081 TaxID=304378 RepID=UPI0021AF69B1|nr:hypothetical protein [Sphingomonas sp. IC081]
MAETGVTIASGEGVAIVPEHDVRDLYAGDLVIMEGLGIPRINVVSLDPDLPRSFDHLATLCELASGFWHRDADRIRADLSDLQSGNSTTRDRPCGPPGLPGGV